MPYGITLREPEFDEALLINAAVACSRALRAAHSLASPLCHYDPSPGERYCRPVCSVPSMSLRVG